MGRPDIMGIDAAFAGGNIVVDRVRGDEVWLHQDLRDTARDWFYWYFRVSGAAGRRLTFHFTGSQALGVRGPAVSHDGGWTWQWVGAESAGGNSFHYVIPADAGEVRFSFGMPYVEAQWQRFVAGLTGNPRVEVGELCRTEKGRLAERMRIAPFKGGATRRVVITCRHHCCEMMANSALEGFVLEMLSESGEGRWRGEHVDLLVIPFVDKDGVEDGDQGKCRRPFDHWLDYADSGSRYATTRAVRRLVQEWGADGVAIWLDLHCPWISGDRNETTYIVGSSDRANAEEQQRFSEVLEATCRGPIRVRARDFLPFGVSWNNDTEGDKQGMMRWACGRPGMRMVAVLELPYATSNGVEVNPTSARALGYDLARATAAYLRGHERMSGRQVSWQDRGGAQR